MERDEQRDVKAARSSKSKCATNLLLFRFLEGVGGFFVCPEMKPFDETCTERGGSTSNANHHYFLSILVH